MTPKDHCPSCGYTEEDARLHGDHRLCKNDGKAPWQIAKDREHRIDTGSPEETCEVCGAVLEFPADDDPMFEGDTAVTSKCRHAIKSRGMTASDHLKHRLSEFWCWLWFGHDARTSENCFWCKGEKEEIMNEGYQEFVEKVKASEKEWEAALDHAKHEKTIAESKLGILQEIESGLRAQVEQLGRQVAEMSKPVTDEEWAKYHGWIVNMLEDDDDREPFQYACMNRQELDKFIASRARTK